MCSRLTNIKNSENARYIVDVYLNFTSEFREKNNIPPITFYF